MRLWDNEMLRDLDMALSTIARHLEPGFDADAWQVRRRTGGAAEPGGGR